MMVIDWFEYNDIIDSLIKKYKSQFSKYQYIYGIPRGGLLLATVLSYKLDIPVIYRLDDQENVLVVDDICDSGKTINRFLNKYDTLVLFVNNKVNNDIKPTYYYNNSDGEWVVFPYEYDINTGLEYIDNVSKVNKTNIEERRNAN